MKYLKLTLWDYVVAACLIAAAWGRSVPVVLLAVIVFLLYLLVRSYVFPSADKNPETSSSGDTTPSETQPISAEEVGNSFEWEIGEFKGEISLDIDIRLLRCNGHFRFGSLYDTAVGISEYEYRVEGSGVLIRLLMECNKDLGESEWGWDVLDGVVQEVDVRARWEREERGDIEKNMADLKESTEWSKLDTTRWGGFKYFVLANKMAKADARRFLRQELERLKKGVSLMTKQATTLGLEATGRPWLRFTDGRSGTIPDDVRKKLDASLETFGISYGEFTCGNQLIAVLQKMVPLVGGFFPPSTQPGL